MSASPGPDRPRIAWIDGRLVPEPQARVPATSAAVLHGLGVFETVRIASGAAPLWERHRARLERACAELALPVPRLDWAGAFAALAQQSAAADGVVRVTLGEGFALLTWRELPPELEREKREGVHLAQVEHARELPALKTSSRAALVQLERRGDGEVLLAQRGELLETSRSNLFRYGRGQLWTAPADRVLPGIARGWVLDRARALGVVVEERAPRLHARTARVDWFLSNAVRGIRRIASIDGRAVGAARDPLSARLAREFDELMRPT